MLERRLLDCYQDGDLRLFPSDADAAAAAEALQMADDARAEQLGREALGEDFVLSGGPAYHDHIFKWTAEAVEPVELRSTGLNEQPRRSRERRGFFIPATRAAAPGRAPGRPDLSSF